MSEEEKNSALVEQMAILESVRLYESERQLKEAIARSLKTHTNQKQKQQQQQQQQKQKPSKAATQLPQKNFDDEDIPSIIESSDEEAETASQSRFKGFNGDGDEDGDEDDAVEHANAYDCNGDDSDDGDDTFMNCGKLAEAFYSDDGSSFKSKSKETSDLMKEIKESLKRELLAEIKKELKK